MKSIPSHIKQGSFEHLVTVVAPFVNTTCILRLKPPSEEWLDDIVMTPTLTTDGEGAIFTGTIPDKVTALAGRLLYSLEFVGGDGESVSSESGSINVLPGVDTNIPDSAADLSQYSMNQIYALLAKVNGNVFGLAKTVGDVMTSTPVEVVIGKTAWRDKNASVLVPEVQADSVISISYVPSEAEEYIESGIVCTGQREGELDFTCEKEPASDLRVYAIVMNDPKTNESESLRPHIRDGYLVLGDAVITVSDGYLVLS
ncbi:MAG: hypothetical protein IKC26_02040 [Clostridia bacterium]|nr:hypothetical protein [Clostridia bacterium]